MSKLFSDGRAKVLEEAGSEKLNPDRPYQALEVLRGIGEKRANKFGPYLALH